jgi:hypothetical protein
MCYKFVGVLKHCRQSRGSPWSAILCEVARRICCRVGFGYLKPRAGAALSGVVGSAMLPLAWGSRACLRVARNFVNWTASGREASELSC